MGITAYPGLTADQTAAFKTLGAQSLSQFGEQLVVERTPVIELNSSYGVSALRDVTSTTGSGSIDDITGSVTTGEILLSTGTTASSTALLTSAKAARYVPGFGGELGGGVRFDAVPTGEQVARWGGRSPITQNDKLYFGYDATSKFVGIDRDGTTTTMVRQWQWNLDTLDGSGNEGNPSGLEVDLSDGVICQIDFTWYGYGQIVWGFILVDRGIQRFIKCHQEFGFGRTSLTTPNFELFHEVENGATTSNLDLYVGGRQFSVVGRYEPDFRIAGEVRDEVAVSSGVVRPLISFQRKSGFQNRNIALTSYSIINTGANPVWVEVRVGGTLDTSSFTTPRNYTASETAVNSDITATSISGGNVVYAGKIVPAGGQGQSTSVLSDVLTFEVPGTQIATLCVGGFGATDVYSAFQLREEW